MKAFKTYATATVSLLVAVLFVGCAHVKPQPMRSAMRLEARTLDDPSLKQFLEQRLDHHLETWPLESWDFPTLTLAAFYFHSNLDASLPERRLAGQRKNRQSSEVEAKHLPDSTALKQRALAWQVRHNLRTNLLAYVAAQRRQELLRSLESTQVELTQTIEKRLAENEPPPIELSLLRVQLAETRLELIESFQKKMNFREAVAEAVGLPVKALLQAEVTYDFRLPAGYGLSARELRSRALRNRSDILLALNEYAETEATLRAEIMRKHPSARLSSGCTWDTENNRWAVNLMPDLPTVSGRNRIAVVEARRVKAAARLLELQGHVIDELDRSAAIYHARLADAVDIDRLTVALRRQHDNVAALFKKGLAIRLELLMARLQLASAEVAQLDAHEKLHEALGVLEDAVQSPGNLIEPSPIVEPERPFTSRDSL